ncbi:MAG TPA: zf-HC2 domain-containing protein [Thermoanaerobaculia bacterium]|nr:zf-HC2 domain-containing protein [Thermoanaerobaculia bacterium]
MSLVHHLPADVLSAYIDEQLSTPERRRAEGHLDGCTTCRERLEGLRRVAVGLRSLERVAPPAILEHGLSRHLVLDAKERGMRGRLEERSLAPRRLPTHFGLGFAMVVAFAAMLYLFSYGVDLRRERAAGTGVGDAAAERSALAFDRDGARWRQEGVAGEPARILDPESEEGRRLLREVPALLALIEGSEGVVLELEGEVVLVRAGPEDDAQGVEGR